MDAQQPDDARCAGDAMLVGTHVWLPADPTERLVSEAELFGCNRLFCSACRSWIRHVDNVRFTGGAPPREDLEGLFVDQRADKYGGFRRGALGFRVHLCRCACVEIAGLKKVGALATASIWSCAGHPTRTADDPVIPAPTSEANLMRLLRRTADLPPSFGDDQPWDFVLRWRQPFLLTRVWPVIDKLLLDPDPAIRARSLELVNAWTVGASTAISRLIAIVRVRADAYPEPDVRADLARTLVNLSVTVRAYRPAIAVAITKMLGGAAPPRGTTVLLAEYEPDALVASAAAWTEDDDDQAAAESTAGAMAMYRRDHLLALLAAFSHRSAKSREDIAAQLPRPLALPHDKLALILAADDIPLPMTHPTVDECRRALRLP